MGLRMRRVMRQWLTGVSVLTVRSGDEVRGMTCNSFNSVSDSPATILVSILQGTRTHDLVSHAGQFSLSILSASQQRWADRYSGVDGENQQGRFDDVPHQLGPAGAPWIEGALGHMDCRVAARHDVGASTLFIAEVDAAEAGDEEAAGLARFRSGYRTV
jgi:flavin reductase (DIM6/NTAB) family NADH-FMN oxidoreductase RutF